MSIRPKSLKILAIETSCDDTGIALVECGGGLRKPSFKVLAEAVSSQIDVHRPFGGVVPNLAKREHIKNLPIVYEKILQKLKIKNSKFEIDCVAVTVGPGLEPALWTGINFAENLSKELNIPVVGANHLEGHIFSNWLPPIGKLPKFPAVILIVSGGHTILLLMESITKWKILGETRDDAVGEAFDKVARMLNLPYPGGPEVEKLATKFRNLIPFPRPMMHEKNYDFSFSGLKTSVLYYIRDNKPSAISHKQFAANICASFQQAVVDVLVYKTTKAVEEFKAKSILLCGGVAANKFLQKQLLAMSHKLSANFHVPPFKYNTDNAVMIAAGAYFNYLQGKKYPLEANGNLSL